MATARSFGRGTQRQYTLGESRFVGDIRSPSMPVRSTAALDALAGVAGVVGEAAQRQAGAIHVRTDMIRAEQMRAAAVRELEDEADALKAFFEFERSATSADEYYAQTQEYMRGLETVQREAGVGAESITRLRGSLEQKVQTRYRLLAKSFAADMEAQRELRLSAIVAESQAASGPIGRMLGSADQADRAMAAETWKLEQSRVQQALMEMHPGNMDAAAIAFQEWENARRADIAAELLLSQEDPMAAFDMLRTGEINVEMGGESTNIIEGLDVDDRQTLFDDTFARLKRGLDWEEALEDRDRLEAERAEEDNLSERKSMMLDGNATAALEGATPAQREKLLTLQHTLETRAHTRATRAREAAERAEAAASEARDTAETERFMARPSATPEQRAQTLDIARAMVAAGLYSKSAADALERSLDAVGVAETERVKGEVTRTLDGLDIGRLSWTDVSRMPRARRVALMEAANADATVLEKFKARTTAAVSERRREALARQLGDAETPAAISRALEDFQLAEATGALLAGDAAQLRPLAAARGAAAERVIEAETQVATQAYVDAVLSGVLDEGDLLRDGSIPEDVRVAAAKRVADIRASETRQTERQVEGLQREATRVQSRETALVIGRALAEPDPRRSAEILGEARMALNLRADLASTDRARLLASLGNAETQITQIASANRQALGSIVRETARLLAPGSPPDMMALIMAGQSIDVTDMLGDVSNAQREAAFRIIDLTQEARSLLEGGMDIPQVRAHILAKAIAPGEEITMTTAEGAPTMTAHWRPGMSRREVLGIVQPQGIAEMGAFLRWDNRGGFDRWTTETVIREQAADLPPVTDPVVIEAAAARGWEDEETRIFGATLWLDKLEALYSSWDFIGEVRTGGRETR